MLAIFSGGEGGRKMTIDFICDYREERGIPQFIEEAPELEYNFVWRTRYACPIGTGLGVGSILLIW